MSTHEPQPSDVMRQLGELITGKVTPAKKLADLAASAPEARPEPLHLEPGVYHDMPMADYLRVEALSASGVVAIHDHSPYRYFAERLTPAEETPLMKLGTALHYAALEPDLFEGRYVVLGQCEALTGKGTQCTNIGSVWRGGQSFCQVKGHDPEAGAPMSVHVLNQKQYAAIMATARGLRASKRTSSFFKRGHSEVVVVAVDRETGVKCKIRLDRDPGVPVHADLKLTTVPLTQRAFKGHASRMRYWHRFRFYRRVLENAGKPATGSVIIAANLKTPEEPVAFIMDEGKLKAKDATITRALLTYKRCMETGVWPKYSEAFPDELVPLDCPPWDDDYAPTAEGEEELPEWP